MAIIITQTDDKHLIYFQYDFKHGLKSIRCRVGWSKRLSSRNYLQFCTQFINFTTVL